MGSVMLGAGFTPPVSMLNPIGLTSWVLPGLWLFATAAVPSAVVAGLAWRRSAWAPPAVLFASATLALEPLVQIPFLGPNSLQAVFGVVAITMTVLAFRSKRAGWWPSTFRVVIAAASCKQWVRTPTRGTCTPRGRDKGLANWRGPQFADLESVCI